MPVIQSETAQEQSFLQRIGHARQASDAIFDLVRHEALYDRPIPERHRIIFYLGHLEAFDWNLLRERVLGVKAFHPEFDRLFAFGIDPVGGGLPSDQPSDWPSVTAVRDYVSQVRSQLDQALSSAITSDRVKEDVAPNTLLHVASEHRLMHVETLAYMLHQLPLDRKVRQSDPPEPESPLPVHRMTKIPAGAARLGLERDGQAFGWDNEFEAHTVQVPAFEIDQYKVTNQQYLEFISAGGYEERSFWTDDDWNWKSASGISHPVFWKNENGSWRYRTMFAEIALPLQWPVYVSYAEASAFARWAGKSLPTEAQWHRAAHGVRHGGETRDLPGNFDFRHWNPIAVNASPQYQSDFGAYGMLGNGWEWTSTPFAPFSGFEPFPFYRGYSADFFDGKHFVMKGGSSRTARCMLRPSFRNWFQAHYQCMYAGFRCVRG